MFLLLYVHTPHPDSAYHLILWVKEDLGTVALLFGPLSHATSQANCSFLLPAFPLSCPDTMPRRLGKMLVTSACVPLPWGLLESWGMAGGGEPTQRSENGGALLLQGAHLVILRSRERLDLQVFPALLCQIWSLPTVILGTLFIPGFYSKWNVKRVQMQRDRSGLWGWGEV